MVFSTHSCQDGSKVYGNVVSGLQMEAWSSISLQKVVLLLVSLTHSNTQIVHLNSAKYAYVVHVHALTVSDL